VIHAGDVAKAMMAAAKRNETGFFVYKFEELKAMSGN
jgi:hypothetical protein